MKQFPLFPRYFRWIALALVVLTVVLGIVLHGNVQDSRKEIGTILVNLVNTALFIYFFTRRKIDDEMFVDMRLKGIAGGVLFMIIGIFATVIWNIMDPGGINEKGEAGRILEGMILINIMFEFQYRKLKRNLDDE